MLFNPTVSVHQLEKKVHHCRWWRWWLIWAMYAYCTKVGGKVFCGSASALIQDLTKKLNQMKRRREAGGEFGVADIWLLGPPPPHDNFRPIVSHFKFPPAWLFNSSHVLSKHVTCTRASKPSLSNAFLEYRPVASVFIACRDRSEWGNNKLLTLLSPLRVSRK